MHILLYLYRSLQFPIPFLVKCLINVSCFFSFSLKMFVSRKYIFQFCFSCFISLQSIWGIHINLTRRQIGDYFSNPYDDSKFCLLTNSICIRNFPINGDICRTCGCNVFERTFNLTSLRCVSNRESLNRGW